MPDLRTIAIATLLLSVSMAGCFGDDEPPTRYTVQASGGSVSDGWAYDGNGLVSAGASIEGNVDVDEDEGTLNVTFEAYNSTWSATLDTFSASEPFQEGGIVQEIPVHGDSGQASTAIPQIRLDLGTWGTAEVLRDGAPYSIQGGDGSWFAHLMLSHDTVRGADGVIAQENATGPYDPSDPTNARVIEDDAQAILEFIAPAGADAARAPQNVSQTVQVTPTAGEGTVEVPTAPYSRATLSVSTNGTQGLQGGDIQIRILDENGTVVADDSAQITPNGGYENTFEVTELSAPGTLVIRGNGTYTATVEGQVAYDDHPFLVLTWNDYTLEPR